MIYIFYFLISYFVPIIIYTIIVYIDMKKGQSFREYLNEYEEGKFMFIPILCPFVNMLFIMIFIIPFIMYWVNNFLESKILNLRK